MRIVYSLPQTLKETKEKLEKIKEQGFDAIQINPIQPLKEEDRSIWWKVFQQIALNFVVYVKVWVFVYMQMQLSTIWVLIIIMN